MRIELPYPPSLNTCFQNIPGRGRAITPRYREWLNEAMWIIKSQKPAKFDVEVSISIGIVAPDKRSRDIDNLIKPCLDVLVKALVIKDDSSKYVRKVSAQWIASGPPCVVLITPFEDIGE
jgi:crossover junction endodeoxyribonuclease RusA